MLIKNVVGYIENPGLGLGFWYVSIPVGSCPTFEGISDELKARWLWHKPDFGGRVYRIRVNLPPGYHLPNDVLNGLVGFTTKAFRIQFTIIFPRDTRDDYDACIMNIVSLGSGSAVNPTDYIDTDMVRERLTSEVYKTAMKSYKEERKMSASRFAIKDIQFNGPATVILWRDGTKTVVKKQDNDDYDQEKAIAMAVARKALGEEGYYSLFHAKEIAEKELKKLRKHLEVLESQYAQMSNRKKNARHRSALALEEKIKSCKTGIKHFEKILKKFAPPF